MSSHAKILIVAPAWIGDAVMSLGLIQGLKEKYPYATIHVLVAPWCQAIYQLSGVVDHIIPFDVQHGQLDMASRWRISQALRKEAYDVAYVLPNSWKSALVPFLARIPKRIGYLGEARWGLLTHWTRRQQNLPLLVQQYQHLAQLSETPIEPRLIVEKELANSWGLDPEKPLLALCPGAEYGPAKRWPTDYFAVLADMYQQQGWQVVVLGSIKDGPVAGKISATMKTVAVNLVGKTSLDDAIQVLNRASLVVSNDSGLMHIASALDRPTIAIFGSSSPSYTPPLSQQARVVYQGVSCSPCFRRDCPLKEAEYLQCLTAITPEQIYQLHQSMRETLCNNG
ncbi:MAG TPA: lipopolysaccharide heptosyltransferase II [Candidatus Nitrosotenuis sp.]|nr:lipopolysaccharide heptosyltransferase II [Candidatus Nitrosotenuis sp.]